jgi:DNA-binding winged helix-turn-helix (wHTH) protein
MRVRFGEFELDEARFELFREGAAVAVQPKVLDLILYLVRNRERMVTKDELFREVWAGVMVTEAALGQAITQARRVLGDSRTEQHMIRTIHGKGFRFVAPVETLEASSRRALRPTALPAALPSVTQPSVLNVMQVPHSTPGSLSMSSTRAGATNPSLDFESPEGGISAGETRVVPHLFVVLHCDQPEIGSSRHSLEGLDEVLIVRGETRRVRRDQVESAARLTLALPGHAVSREHASIVRIRESWFAVDNHAKNGTFVNGERIKRHRLRHGDVIECGSTFLLFEEHNTPECVLRDAEGFDLGTGAHFSLLPTLQAKQHYLNRIARTNLPFLLVGETGVGKAHAAHGFHLASGRSGAFVKLDAGALFPERAIMQLLGNAAVSGEIGFVRAANGGTLFLEHLQNLSAPAQACLLRVIDEGVVVPAGSSQQESVDVRFVAATSANLRELAEQGRFSHELLAHFTAFELELPPLRKRRGDLGIMVAAWMRDTQTSLRLSSACGLSLLRHSFPNNCLELRHCLTSAMALAQSELVDVQHLPATFAASTRVSAPRA